ncbi:hypothetical protein GCM10009716_09910 [Streptomyces sodiiphilus]|uniref:Uncharacterized protein n=1 Tax=Streptomyces sodiiphilus TaxID=226217 RepID=A0ABP5A3C5_9ACTN
MTTTPPATRPPSAATAPHPPADGPTVIGLDCGTPNPGTADHLLHRLADLLPLPQGSYACTHRAPAPRPHIALSLRLPDTTTAEAVLDRLAAGAAAVPGLSAVLGDRRLGPPARRGTAAAAADAHATRTGGRAVLFPGSDTLTGTLTLRELLARTAITRTEVLGGVTPDPDAVLDTRGHVRPEWADGELLLRLMPASGGTYLPFEIPDPHPCCTDHP